MMEVAYPKGSKLFLNIMNELKNKAAILIKMCVECKICNRKFNTNRAISTHIRHKHLMSVKEYYDKFIKRIIHFQY